MFFYIAKFQIIQDFKISKYTQKQFDSEDNLAILKLSYCLFCTLKNGQFKLSYVFEYRVIFFRLKRDLKNKLTKIHNSVYRLELRYI